MPRFFLMLLFFASASQAVAVNSASFNRSTSTLSLDLSVNGTSDAIILPPAFVESASSGEFSLAGALSINFSLNQSALLQVNPTSPVFSAAGGLADMVDDGCIESIGGRDMCELRGFTQTGDFHWCAPCDYFNPGCGNYLLHDWCYRYYPLQTHAAATGFTASDFDFTVSVAASNYSCAVSPSANCSQGGFSAELAEYSTNFSLPGVAFVKPVGAVYWQSVSPAVLRTYFDALSAYDSGYPSSLAGALSSSAALNSALSVLLANASGNYSDSFNFPLSEQAVFPNLSVSFGALAFNFTPLHGHPEIIAANPSLQTEGGRQFFAVSLKNAGFKDDVFSLDVSCNDSVNYSFSPEINASEAAVIKLYALNATLARECAVFAYAAANPLLNDSAVVFFDAFSPPSVASPPCCQQSAASSSGSAGFSSTAPAQLPQATPSLVPTASPTPLQPTAPPLVFTELPPLQEDYAVLPTAVLPTALSLPSTTAVPPSSAVTALFLLSAAPTRQLLVFLSSTAACALAYLAFRRKIRFSKRFSSGRVRLRLENLLGAAAEIVVRDFVPEDAVFATPPHSIDETILGRLAEWRVASLQKNEFFELSYSCAAPLARPASAEFSVEGKRFRLEAS